MNILVAKANFLLTIRKNLFDPADHAEFSDIEDHDTMTVSEAFAISKII